jgi:hypothetical protein
MQESFSAIALKQDFKPSRGTDSHPDYCWRIFDHQRELVLHQKDYAQFKNSIVVIDPSGLSNAKTEVTKNTTVNTTVPFGSSDSYQGSNGSQFPGDSSQYPNGTNFPQDYPPNAPPGQQVPMNYPTPTRSPGGPL